MSLAEACEVGTQDCIHAPFSAGEANRCKLFTETGQTALNARTACILLFSDRSSSSLTSEREGIWQTV
jgi:hypothetical protein